MFASRRVTEGACHARSVRREPSAEWHASKERFRSLTPVLAFATPALLLVVAALSVLSCTGFDCQQSRGSFAVLLMTLAAPTFLPLLFVPGDPPFMLLIAVGMATSLPLWPYVGRYLAGRTLDRTHDLRPPSYRRFWAEYGAVSVGWLLVGVTAWRAVS